MVFQESSLHQDLKSTTTRPDRLVGRSNVGFWRYLSFYVMIGVCIGAFLVTLLQYIGNTKALYGSQDKLRSRRSMAAHSILSSSVANNNKTQQRRRTLPLHGSNRINTSPDISKTAPNSGFRRLGRPYVISLEHRTDRMEKFTRGMADAGITNFTVIPGVPHKCPQLGVTLAHVAWHWTAYVNKTLVQRTRLSCGLFWTTTWTAPP